MVQWYGTRLVTKGSGFDSQLVLNFFLLYLFAIREIKLLIKNKQMRNIFSTMVVVHFDVHVHEHLLDKRVMHMHMHIP